ncbi:NADP-dependent oxidoreductase [Nocardioides rubriscoriae]|uniref:NADP-dependent oxidoreductase n=1 Tax=Nocardioides rubriscoriae TaxID=642762 RepID=UPI0011DFB844|nr:NADP-dependent oxidoreductase [Nocardioides rubriscoriae]
MRAIAFSTYGPADVLEVVELPLPHPGPGQVRVRVAAASVNPADWRLRSGQFRRFLRISLPFVPGCDVAGVVDAVGSGVSLEIGDPVIALQPTKIAGAYAEQVIVDAASLAPAPAGLALDAAAALPLCGLTALQALRRAGLSSGDRLLVYGAAGGVGTLAVQIGGLLGAEVTAACAASGRELVAGLGAARVLDRERDDLASPGSYDVVFDAVNALPFRRSRQLLRAGGTAVTVNPFAARLAPDWLAFTRNGRRLRSVLVQPDAVGLATLSSWASQGDLRPVVERSYPLEQASSAHERSQTGRVHGKLLLVADEALAAHVPGSTGWAASA